jgi:hypothetical protein
MRRAARRGQNRAVEAWDHLGDELSWMARRKKKQLRRGVTRSGWALEDLLDSVVGRAHGRRPQKRHEEDDAPRKEQIIVEED